MSDQCDVLNKFNGNISSDQSDASIADEDLATCIEQARRVETNATGNIPFPKFVWDDAALQEDSGAIDLRPFCPASVLVFRFAAW